MNPTSLVLLLLPLPAALFVVLAGCVWLGRWVGTVWCQGGARRAAISDR